MMNPCILEEKLVLQSGKHKIQKAIFEEKNFNQKFFFSDCCWLQSLVLCTVLVLKVVEPRRVVELLFSAKFGPGLSIVKVEEKWFNYIYAV